MTEEDFSGIFGIALILGTSAAITWYLVHVAKVEWFRQRFLNGTRAERMAGAIPVAVPVFIFFMIFIRPLFP